MRLRRILLLVLIISFALAAFKNVWAADKQEQDFFVAQKAFSDGFYDLALESVEHFMQSYPNSPQILEAYLLKSKCLLYQEKYPEALLEFEKLSALSGSSAIKDAIIYWTAETHFKSGALIEAKKLFDQLIRDFPKSSYLADSYYSAGWIIFEEANYSEAIKYLRKIGEQFPNNELVEDAQMKICEAYYNLKDYSNLKNNLTRFLREYTRFAKKAQALFYLAESDYYLGDYPSAINEYLRTIEASKEPLRKDLIDLASLGIGWCYIKLNNFNKAQDYLNQISSDLAILAKASLLSSQKEYEKALSLYEELIKNFPNSKCLIEAHLGKADCLYELKRYEEAIWAYKSALEEIPKEPSTAKDLLVKVYNGLAAAYLRLGRYKEAISELENLAQNSDDKEVQLSVMCQIADAYKSNSQFKEATDAYNRILKEFGNNAYSDYIEYHLGLSLTELGKYEEAFSAFNNLIINFPKSELFEEANFQLAVVYFKKGDFQKAQELFNDFSLKFPKSSLKNDALYFAGESLYNLGDNKGAINTLESILKESTVDSKLAENIDFEIANILNQIGESREALKRLNNFVNNHPDSELRPQALLWLGRYYTQNGSFDMARRNLWRLIREHPLSQFVDDAFYYIGEIFLEEKKYDLALIQFQKVLEFPDTNLGQDAYIAIIDIYKENDNLDRALSTCRELIRKFPDFKPTAYEKMADIYKEFGRYQEAISNYLEVINLASSPQLYFKLGDTYENKGNLDEAIKSYQKIIESYPGDTHWFVKGYLRIARIFEERRQYPEAAAIYKKLAVMDVEEAKYAQEKLSSLKQGTHQQVP